MTVISMCHLKPPVSLGRFIKYQNADAQIALCIDTVYIPSIITLHRKMSQTVCVV